MAKLKNRTSASGLSALGSTAAPSSGGLRSAPVARSWRSLSAPTPALQKERLNISRHLIGEVPFVGYLIGSMASEAIGKGLNPKSISKNPDFAKKATLLFDRWADSKAIDLSRKHTFYSAQRLLAHTVMVDGSVFVLKLRDESKAALAKPLTDKTFRRLQFQFLHRDQVGNGNGSQLIANGSDYVWDQGVKFDAYDRPLAYRVLLNKPGYNYQISSEFVTRRESEMLHIYEPLSFGQRHGNPWIFAAGKSGLDAIDISALRTIGAKIQSTFLGALQTRDGNLPASLASIVRKGTASGDGTTVEDNGMRYIELPGGVNIPIFAEGQTLSFFQGRENMPFGEIVRDLWIELCQGLGVPSEYLIDLASNGSSTNRFVISRVKRFLDRVREVIKVGFCQPAWEFVIGDAIARGELEAVEDWAEVHWLGGGLDPSIDVGRDEKAEQNRLLTNTGTREAYCANFDLDGEEVGKARLREVIDDAAYGMEYAASKGVVLPPTAFLPLPMIQALAGAANQQPETPEPTPATPPTA